MGKPNLKNTKSYKLGEGGENKVMLHLNTLVKPEFNLHNIMLLDGDDTHQIDAISITTAGVFVIEVKNVCGYKIQCGNDLKYWTYDWKKDGQLVTCKLYNPIWQNRTHVEQIRKVLGYPDYPIFSMVVFANNNTLEHSEDLDEMCVSLKNMGTYMKLFTRGKINDEQRQAIKQKILANHHPEISLLEHVKNVNKIRGN